jgi:RNA polymerase sigma factor (sigma-70 family)
VVDATVAPAAIANFRSHAMPAAPITLGRRADFRTAGIPSLSTLAAIRRSHCAAWGQGANGGEKKPSGIGRLPPGGHSRGVNERMQPLKRSTPGGARLELVPVPRDQPREGRPEDSLNDRGSDELMRLAQQGLAEAFVALVERYKVRLVRTATRYLNDEALAWDVVQQTYSIVLVDKLHEYQFSDRFQSYIFSVLINQCFQALRRAKRARALDAGQEPEPTLRPRVEDELLARQATSCLTPKLLEVVTLRYGAGLSFGEIAEILGIRLSTARGRHCEAMKKMLGHLEGS